MDPVDSYVSTLVYLCHYDIMAYTHMSCTRTHARTHARPHAPPTDGSPPSLAKFTLRRRNPAAISQPPEPPEPTDLGQAPVQPYCAPHHIVRTAAQYSG